MDEDDEIKRKRAPPRIIRQTASSFEPKPKEEVPTFELDPDTEQSDQVIVIGLDETGQQPSEEQLTAIIQVCYLVLCFTLIIIHRLFSAISRRL